MAERSEIEPRYREQGRYRRQPAAEQRQRVVEGIAIAGMKRAAGRPQRLLVSTASSVPHCTVSRSSRAEGVLVGLAR